MNIVLIQGPPGSNKKKIHDELVNFLRTVCKKQVAELHIGEELKHIVLKKRDSSEVIHEYIKNGVLVPFETTVPIWKKTLTELAPNVDWVIITGALRFAPEVTKFLLFVSEMEQVKKVIRLAIDLPIPVCRKNMEQRIDECKNGTKESYINHKVSAFQKTTIEAMDFFYTYGKKYPFVSFKKINGYQDSKLVFFDMVTGLSNKKKRTTIAGDNCSGKSTIAKLIANKLTIASLSSGDYARSIANGSGVSVEKACATAMEDKPAVENFDDRIDDWVKSHNNDENFIMDSRLAFHLIPNSFKVRLELDAKTASEWVWENTERREKEIKENNIKNKEEFQMITEKRLVDDIARYQKRNSIDIRDRKHYDLVINVKHYKNQTEKIAELVLEGYYKWLIG